MLLLSNDQLEILVEADPEVKLEAGPHLAASAAGTASLASPRVTFVRSNSTFGSLTFRVFTVKVATVGSPMAGNICLIGGIMKFVHVCYVALGFAVARLFFKRQALDLADPVSRFRTSGLL